MNHERLSDEELLALVADGRTEALEAFYDRYAGLVLALARRITRDLQSAEEVVQDTFITVWRQSGSYDPLRGRPYSWLVRIARNRAIDEFRRASARDRRSQSSEREFADEAPGPAQRVAAAAGREDLRRLVGEALEVLPGPQREVVELSYFRGLSQTEISTRTGTPLGTVKTRMRLALGKLREKIRPEAGERMRQDGLL